MTETSGPRATTDRWTAFTDRELGTLLGGLEAADREGSIDDAVKALLAESAGVLRRRTRPVQDPAE